MHHLAEGVEKMGNEIERTWKRLGSEDLHKKAETGKRVLRDSAS